MTYDYLPHLHKCVPSSVSPDKLSMYTVALEGWRRGLPLKFYTTQFGNRREINYSFEYEGKEYKFAVAKGEDVTQEAMKIAKDKYITKNYLLEKNVSVPQGKKFDKTTDDEMILNYANQLGYPVVLKPTNANLGEGVIANIQNKGELEQALKQVRNDLGYQNIIVEKHIEGEEVRVYVINGKVIAAMKRIPAYIIGDGKHTIKELIALKNEERRKNPNYKGRNIIIDKELKQNIEKVGYDLNSILEEGKQLFLRNKSNISAGGESIDVTDEITDEIKNLAVAATKAIPGLAQAGVDIIVNEKENSGAVLEINTRPGIGGHLFPSEGKARDIPKAIIDYYFPNTKRMKNSTQFYFDYGSVQELLNSGLAEEVIVPPVPTADAIIKEFYIKGNLNSLSLKRRIQRLALGANLYGYLEPNSEESGKLVIAGTEENIKIFLDNLQKEKNIEISESDREIKEPLRAGFVIRKLSKKDKNSTHQYTKKSSKKQLTFKQKLYNKFGDSIIWKIYRKLKKG